MSHYRIVQCCPLELLYCPVIRLSSYWIVQWQPIFELLDCPVIGLSGVSLCEVCLYTCKTFPPKKPSHIPAPSQSTTNYCLSLPLQSSVSFVYTELCTRTIHSSLLLRATTQSWWCRCRCFCLYTLLLLLQLLRTNCLSLSSYSWHTTNTCSGHFLKRNKVRQQPRGLVLVRWTLS